MAVKVHIEDDDVRRWVEVAHGVRMLHHCLRNASGPVRGSRFAQVATIYPFEPVVDRVRSYLSAGIEHLSFWADLQAPLKFHPEASIEVTLRPTYTLARAAIEASSQAIWLMDTTDPMECIRRHICLIRWDLEEQRKSHLDLTAKEKFKNLDADVVRRVSEVFPEDQIRPPSSYLDVIKWACNASGLDLAPETAERVWRAASGVAHGKYWPSLELQQDVVVEDDADGQSRTVTIPNLDGLTEVLEVGHAITQIGVLRFLDYSGADIAAALKLARDWVAQEIPLREGVDRAEAMRDAGLTGLSDE